MPVVGIVPVKCINPLPVIQKTFLDCAPLRSVIVVTLAKVISETAVTKNFAFAFPPASNAIVDPLNVIAEALL